MAQPAKAPKAQQDNRFRDWLRNVVERREMDWRDQAGLEREFGINRKDWNAALSRGFKTGPILFSQMIYVLGVTAAELLELGGYPEGWESDAERMARRERRVQAALQPPTGASALDRAALLERRHGPEERRKPPPPTPDPT